MYSIPVCAYFLVPSPHVVYEIGVHEDTIACVAGGLPLRAVGKEHSAYLDFYSAHVSPPRTKVLLLILCRLNYEPARTGCGFPGGVVDIGGSVLGSGAIQHEQPELSSRDDLA